MKKWIRWLGLCAGMAAGAASAAPDGGLVLSMTASGQGFELQSIAAVGTVPGPRSFVGTSWHVSATDRDGRGTWSRPFPAPRSFHAAHEGELSFAIVIPRVEPGSRVTIHDGAGAMRWTVVVDDALLADAHDARDRIMRDLQHAKSATARLHRSGLRRAAQERRMPPPPDQAPVQPPKRNAGASVHVMRSPQKNAQAAGGETMYRVSGIASINNYDVRAFDADSGRFVVSTRADWTNSRYEVALPRGRYVFEIDDNRIRGGSPFFYRTPARSAPIVVQGETEVPSIDPSSDAGWLEFNAELPCTLALAQHTYHSPLALTMATEVRLASGARFFRGGRDAMDFMAITRPDPAATTEYCTARYRLQLTPGTYSFEFSLPGWMPVRMADTVVASGATVSRTHRFLKAERTLVWRGRVLDARGQPLTNYHVSVVDQLNNTYWWRTSFYETDGNFDIPYSPGWIADFEPSRLSVANARQRFILDGRPLPSTVVVDDLADDSVLDSGLIRIHGSGERTRRYNILFLAEGYSGVEETFTDTNGNGGWDGFYWLDRNGDGVFNDYFRTVGSPDYALLDTPNPLSGNEPFSDTNGDGVLNRSEGDAFQLHARDFMRALLGADFWNEHRHGFNAYLLFEPSMQTGFDITQPDGRRSLERDTRYGANLVLPRALMEVDRGAAMQRAVAALPEIDMVVVLVNQPVFLFARGNVTLAQPGSMVWPVGGDDNRGNLEMGPSHEMGHFVGSLCDEYDEFAGVHPRHGDESIWCPNASYLSDPARVPWANGLPTGVAVPNVGLDGALGIFEGADYYIGGAYRPTYNSTMRFNAPLFNAPSRAALEAAIHDRIGPERHAEDSTGRCRNLPVNAVHLRGARC